MWGEPAPVTGSQPAVEQPAAASLAPSRTAAEPQAPIRSSSKPPPPPPPPPPPAEAAGAHALAAGLAPVKACAEGCHTRGNCNEELGRCDCPPLSEGPICDRGVVPKCRTQWGLSLPHAPCQAWTSESDDWRARPPVTHAIPPATPCHPACDPMQGATSRPRATASLSATRSTSACPTWPGASTRRACRCSTRTRPGRRSSSRRARPCSTPTETAGGSAKRAPLPKRLCPATPRRAPRALSRAHPPHPRRAAHAAQVHARSEGGPAERGAPARAQCRAGAAAGARRRGEPGERCVLWAWPPHSGHAVEA